MDGIRRFFGRGEAQEEVAEEQEPELLLHKAWKFSWPQHRDEFPESLRPYLQFICDALAVDFVPYPGKQREDLCELITPSGDPRSAHISVNLIGTPYISVYLLRENKSGSVEPPFDWERILTEVRPNSSYR